MKTILLLLIISANLVGCSGGSVGQTGTNSYSPSIPNTSIQQSQFAAIPLNQQLSQIDCSNNSTQGTSSKNFLFRTSDNSFRIEQDLFDQLNCGGQILSTGKINYTLASFAPLTSDPTFQNLTVVLVSKEIQFYSSIYIGAANSGALYGFTDWDVALNHNITCLHFDVTNSNSYQEDCTGKVYNFPMKTVLSTFILNGIQFQ